MVVEYTTGTGWGTFSHTFGNRSENTVNKEQRIEFAKAVSKLASVMGCHQHSIVAAFLIAKEHCNDPQYVEQYGTIAAKELSNFDCEEAIS